MSQQQRTILIVAGEASGDQHGADLVKAINAIAPQYRFVGIGGDKMQAAGVTLLYHIRDFAILGISEVIRHLPFLRRVLKKLQQKLREIDAVILIDYPGFNLRLARLAHEAGKKVIYYICPQLWAWGERRVHNIRKYVDLALVIFEFEERFYRQRGVTAYWVGHPLVDQLQEIAVTRDEFFQQNNFPEDKPLVTLLPGSRRQEVERLLPLMVAAMAPLATEVSIAIGQSPTLDASFYQSHLKPNMHLLVGQTHALMKHADVAIVASGTATLELGYFQTPMVVVYRVSPITYWLGKRLVTIENIALVNIIAGKRIVPELIQEEASAEQIQKTLKRLLTDKVYYHQMKQALAQIPTKLGPPGASKRAAQKIVELVE